MDAGIAPSESGVPVKEGGVTENTVPTQSEPKSEAAAEMSGALATEKSGDGATATTDDVPKNVDGPIGTSSEAPQPAPESTATESKLDSSGAAADDTEMQDVDHAAPTDAVSAEDTAPKTNGTPATKKSGDSKRRSSAGVPEHKSKKLNKKKSAAKITHLDAKPGEYYFARLKSYPPWPSMVCDEEMLPQTLLSNRPITTKKDDGTYNEAYADGGKKVLDRTFPVMFLYTNEFAWIPNTDLSPLNPEDCKDVAEKGKSKTLIAAYQVAGENHNLQYFKDMLVDHARAVQEEVDFKEAKQAEKVAKADKKKRKSEAKVETDDVEMEDADEAAEPKKSSKKRKKEAETDEEEPEKPAKTPKTTKLKLTTNKTPTTTEKKPKEKAPKPKSEKKKASKPSPSDEEAPEVREEKPEKPLDPAEARKAREKEVLFLRHKLQKGFLSREQAPHAEEMPQMSNFLQKLEDYGDLEVSIIRATKINKVLKALIKLATIPKDEDFAFRKRSIDLLSRWNKILGAEPADGETTGSGDKDGKSTPTTNGVHEDKAEEKKEDSDKTAESTEKPLSDAEAGPKISTAEPPKTDEVKPSVVDKPKPSTEEVSSSKIDAPSTEMPLLDKAPASAEAAAQVQEVVKANE